MSSSTSLLPDPDAAARPRNRRLISTGLGTAGCSATASPAHSRGVSPNPTPTPRWMTGPGGSVGKSKNLLDTSSWAWSSVQDFASSLLAGAGSGTGSGSWSRNGSRSRTQPISRDSSNTRKADIWGPAPPDKSRPRIEDVGAGSSAKREAELIARRTASVLESHPGANGGLDVAGAHKRRNSDERPRTAEGQEVEDYLVYIHHVRRTDTYAGIVLKYRCREDVFRRANGLWSRDNIQIKKWLTLPVDACEVRGRPCAAPSADGQQFDLLAPTPQSTHQREREADGYFPATNGLPTQPPPQAADEQERPWTHVKWVTLDSSSAPVEIGRVSRRALGYFPPRRKKSLHTTSSLSTPRQSIDIPSIPYSDSPVSTPSRNRGGSLTSSGRPRIASAYGASPPAVTRGRTGSIGNRDPDDPRPAWMRRPGGVGSMNRNVHMPGPEKDYLNTWTRKHIPGMVIDSLPSMSVMGSETASFGFRPDRGDGTAAAVIAESPFEAGRETNAVGDMGKGQQGMGLDKAAAAVETWLRGAFAKTPGTPVTGQRADQGLGDLIELEDTNSDDGRGVFGGSGLLSQNDHVASGLGREGQSAVRVRGGAGAGAAKGKKAD